MMRIGKIKSLALFVLMVNALLASGNIGTVWVPISIGEITTFVPAAPLSTSKNTYEPNETVKIHVNGSLSGDHDWAGIYRVGDSNDWDNVIAWNWVGEGDTVLNRDKKPMPAGEYEVRLFFHNSFNTEASYTFRVAPASAPNNYGQAGSHDVSTYTEADNGNSIVYYPSDIAHMPKTPLLFFCPGWNSQDPASYETLLRFIASHGYSVIYAKDHYGDPATLIRRFEKILDNNNDVLPYVDTTRIGVIGHSSGGGDTFKILDHFSQKGYGANGRLLMALDPWFAFGMNSDAMRHLPANTNVVIQRYDNADRTNNETDARIPLSEYALLGNIADNKKDYQVYTPATHGYPTGSRSVAQMQGLLEPLGALMAYTFENDANAHHAALENGSDHPYNDGVETVRPLWTYDYRCNSHGNRAEVMEIDYCHQYLGGKHYPADTVFDEQPEANIPKPDYLASYIDPIFGNKVTRITDRANQNANAHNYPKTQSWNADMSLIRLGYRLYNADDFSESSLTQNQHLRGSLTEMKWSGYDPDVFYGIDVRSDRFVFMKAKINDDNTITYTDMPNATFMKSEYDELKLGKYEGNLDYQDNYVVFAGRKKDTNRVTLIVYHLQNNYGTTYNQIVAQKTFNEMKWYAEDANGNFNTSSSQANQMFDWASISALGNYVIVNYRSKKGDPEQEYTIEQYDRSLNHIRRLAESAAHGDLGVDANGKEVYVQFGFGTLNGVSNIGIWEYPLDGSSRIRLLPDKYNGGHISCRNYQRPGWCYVNTRYLDTRDEDHPKGQREVFAIKLDDTQTVERFAQTHNTTGRAWAVQVGVSPDGTQVLFASDFGDANGVIDTYHVSLPNQ